MDVRLRMVTLFVGVFFSCNTVAQELKTFGDSVAYAFGCSSAFGLSFDKKFDKFVCSGFECGLQSMILVTKRKPEMGMTVSV